MKSRNIEVIVPLLRARLLPSSDAAALVDPLEGERPEARKSAVLLALFEQEREIHLIFIRRARGLRAHSGEIAFPGGSYDALDLSLIETARREAFEEIALAPERVEVLGLLPAVFTRVSNFLILPVVAYLPGGPGLLQAQPTEVDEVLLLPLRALADPSIAHTEIWSRDEREVEVHFYDYGALRIWGATGRILASLLALLQDF